MATSSSPSSALCEPVTYDYLAGCVELSGRLFAARRADILRRTLRCIESETARHPEERIKRIEAFGGRLEVWTSHARLARRMGDILQERFGGRLSYHFERAPEVLRVVWRCERRA